MSEIFSELVNDENSNNCEKSSDDGGSSNSDNEPEIQYDESDDSDTEEEEVSDLRNHVVCGRTWTYISQTKNNVEIQNPSRMSSLTINSEHVKTIDECFYLFINKEIIDTVIRHTNNKAMESVLPNQKWKLVDETEIDAFFGLLLLIGRFRESRERKQDLWKQDTSFSRSCYAAIMSRDRFTNILKYIRFDESATRDERKSTDKLAPLRQIVNVFTENCKKSYSATNTGCVDEQLMTFRGRCSFKVYMASKPGKYGIKIWTLCYA
ncbi:PiggyBac transposable element-derived protein 4 [Anthophora quadrimaculata]